MQDNLHDNLPWVIGRHDAKIQILEKEMSRLEERLKKLEDYLAPIQGYADRKPPEVKS